MKIAIYARESSDDTTKSPPITEQILRGESWAQQHGHTVEIVYKDDGWSGGDWNRPSWKQSVNDAKRHLFQILWVWNQDRIARDTEQFLWYYRILKESRTRIFEDTSNEYIDMESLGGRVKHQGLAQAAEIFRLVTSEKVRKAYERKKAKGESWGRPEKIVDLQAMQTLRAQGLGWRAIAKQTGVSYQTVKRRLQNRVIVSQTPKGPFDAEK